MKGASELPPRCPLNAYFDATGTVDGLRTALAAVAGAGAM